MVPRIFHSASADAAAVVTSEISIATTQKQKPEWWDVKCKQT